MNIRVARSEDLPDLVLIYNQAVAAQLVGDLAPVSVAQRREWFEHHDPQAHPIYVAEVAGGIAGWCSLSPYRPGRMALRHTAEISYFVAMAHRRQGVAQALTRHAIACCPSLAIKNLFAIVIDRNEASCKLLVKLGFDRWGFLPRVVDFGGEECGHLYFGRRVS